MALRLVELTDQWVEVAQGPVYFEAHHGQVVRLYFGPMIPDGTTDPRLHVTLDGWDAFAYGGKDVAFARAAAGAAYLICLETA